MADFINRSDCCILSWDFVIIDNAKSDQSILVRDLRCRDWLFHPAVRKYSNPKAKAIIYRYPSPGNATFEPVMPIKEQDYKTPYANTPYNVRYANPTPMQTK